MPSNSTQRVGRGRVVVMKCLATRLIQWQADSPDVTVRVGDRDVAPAMRIIGRRLENSRLSGLRSSVHSVRIDAQNAEFGSGTAKTRRLQASEQRMVVVSVVRMEHELEAEQLDRGG